MDHVPPRCFFASLVITELKPDNLWTLPTHVKCNNAFKDDEEYFVETMRLRVGNTWAGGALQLDFLGRVTKRDETRRLFGKTFREIVWQPFTTPTGRGANIVGLRHDEVRTKRVCWKIIRGLFFKEYERLLPEDTAISFWHFFSLADPPEESWPWWQAASGAGAYPYCRVFDYRFQTGKDTETGDEWWAFRLWESLIYVVGFPSPTA